MPAKRTPAIKSATSKKSKTAKKPARIEDLDPAMKGKKVAADALAALRWRSYRDKKFTVEGLAWFHQDNLTLRRLPGRAEGKVREAVWNLAQHTSGGRIRFRTDSRNLTLKIRQPFVEMLNMCPIGHSGIDLYVGAPGQQVYWNVTRPNLAAQRAGTPYEAMLFDGLEILGPRQLRDLTLYLPVYNRLDDLEIGLDADAKVLPPTPWQHAKPIVFYGTSITQSGCSSRPSNGFVPILGRQLNAQVVNLGFSGNGLGEPEVAALVSEIDASIFVLDYEANAGLDRMRDNLLPFCETIRAKHPTTPLVLVTKIGFPKMNRMPGGAHGRTAALELFHRVADQINHRFPGPTLVVDGWTLIDATTPFALVDESHPTDYGFAQMAARLAPVLHACLPKS